MRKTFLIIALHISYQLASQELFVYSEPASNIPAKSINLKLADHYFSYDKVFGRQAYRVLPEVQIGVYKKLSLYLGITFSDMHTVGFEYESCFMFAKYRFLTLDDIHKHFRMAVFINASKTEAPFHYDEAGLSGDKTGIDAGVISTLLSNKFALSATVSHIQLLDTSRFRDVVYLPQRVYQAMYYSLSAGYLLFPREYHGYNQLNVNLYLETLAQQSLNKNTYYIDLAPAVQFIISSNTKINIGYRFQTASNMDRTSKNSWTFSVERLFLDLIKKKK